MKAIDIIKQFEGLRLKPYLCPAGLLTIGYGHVIKSNEHFTEISEVYANQLLEIDINLAINKVKKLIYQPLNDNQLASITSFTFNLGAGALQRSTLRQKINRGEHELVETELMKWVYSKGRKLPGLVKRRQIEGVIYNI
ncbi:MAG: lysozyme [Alphaproteobacteria bacterium]|nr:lysozyme [Alphaproteobacteria bacterium]OJV14108.1 MAG: hypothetical protein BGO27_01310 [Alphaproteobacteria bacterium 33-17]